MVGIWRWELEIEKLGAGKRKLVSFQPFKGLKPLKGYSGFGGRVNYKK